MKKIINDLENFNITELKSLLTAIFAVIARKQEKIYRTKVRMLDARKDLHPVCKQ